MESYLNKIYEGIWKIFPFITFEYGAKWYGDDVLTMSCWYRNKYYQKQVVISQEFIETASPQLFDAMADKIIKEAISDFSTQIIGGVLR